MTANSLGKSLLLALAGTGLLFFFLMMGIIPIMAILARINSNIEKSSVVVDPAHLMRTLGLPLAIAAFVLFFLISLYRFRRIERAALSARH